MPYSAKAIANYFIGKSVTDPKSTLSPLKLIKLVYIAHGFYLDLKNEKLINETVEAWKYGPVIRSLYDEFRKYGASAITHLAKTEEISPQDDYTHEFLNEVWDAYGSWTGTQLSAWTHEDGSPWYISTEGGTKLNDQIIPDASIKNYFRLLRERNEMKAD